MNYRGFEIISEYQEVLTEDFIPTRETKDSAGYDFRCAKDTIVPSLFRKIFELGGNDSFITQATSLIGYEDGMNLDNAETMLEAYGCRPVLVPTGIKAKFTENEYLGLKARSSTPLKYLLIVANGEGVIDSDYYNNPKNEGHIMVQLINLSPFDILIRKGEKIAQGIFIPFNKADEDNATTERIGGYGSTGKR